ncbi:MAG: glycosyltransferase [candidate division KSB1 bacterium]|nr:glycosyltransferase [candidate division KSB1 bacterium]MDZ7301016.1 glycosyltransferase [candidate division KSB1 bacterium]MDZ7310306.1 glycosyltransferase [candidate division KSB1 bacterium]
MSQRQPKVSVIIPLYNAAPYIAACLESILAQTFKDFEIVVADDGSTDASIDIVKKYQQLHSDKIVVCAHPDHANRGITATRNLAIRHARGEYLAFIDNDDLWLPEKLTRQVEILDHFPEIVLVYAKIGFIDARNNSITVDGNQEFGSGTPHRPASIFRRLLLKNPIPSVTVLARKSSVENVGAFDETMRYNEDRLVWSKMAVDHPVFFIPEKLALYRVHETNFSRKLAQWHAFTESEFQYLHKLIDFLAQQDVKLLPRSALSTALFTFFIRTWLWGAPRRLLVQYARAFFKQLPFLKYRLPFLGLLVGLLLGPRLGIGLKRLHRTKWAENGASVP